MKQQSLFPTPLWHFRHPNLQACVQLSQHVLELERQDPTGLQLTNQGGWHSSTDLIQDPAFQDIFHWIAGCCHGAFQGWGWDFSKTTPTFNNAWAMVNRFGHSTRAHLHPNSLFSGVMYLQVPEGAGAIAFLDPRAGSQMLLPPLRTDAKEDQIGRLRHQPLVGELLLFPAWLWHEVEPSIQVGERVALSFNIGMRQK